AGEDDVAGLVADEQGAYDTRGLARDVDDRDAVREVVDDPDLARAPHSDGDGLEADGHAAGGRERAGGADVEDLEVVLGGVRDEELRAIRGERDRPDGTA